MKNFTLILTLLLLISCKENSNPEDYKNKSLNSSDNLSNPSKNSTSTEKEKISWNKENIKNFEFVLPSNFNLESKLSSYNKKVYVSRDETLGLSIDIADLPNGYENSKITGMISNLNDFGNSINQDNKIYFDDFQLINTKYSYLGNIEAVEVSQTSTKVSGKNIKMRVKSYFVISNANYYSITFSYPTNSYQDEQTIQKIINSFKFEIKKQVEKDLIGQTLSDNSSQPTLKESQDWLLSKLNKYLSQVTNYSDGRYGPINKSVITITNVTIQNNNLIFKYNYKLYEPYVDEKTQSKYDYAGISRDIALKLSKDKRLTHNENSLISIPLKSISNTYYEKEKNYKGECDFSISTTNNDITEKNLTKGTTKYTSYFSFTYDCSKEDDLGNRINNAIQHIIKLMPNVNKANNELF